MAEERWEFLAKFDIGVYEISDRGSVRIVQKAVKPHIIQEVQTPNGWLHLLDGRKFKVDMLVANAFVPNPLNCLMLKHKDDDPNNNFAKNLMWVEMRRTQVYDEGKIVTVKDEAEEDKVSKPGRLVVQYSMSGEAIATFASVVDASDKTGVDTPSIYRTLSGLNKSTHGFIFKWEDDAPPEVDSDKFRPINLYDKDGTFVQSFNNVANAALVTKTAASRILSICRGETKPRKMYFEFAGEAVAPSKSERGKIPSKKVKVRQYGSSGFLVYTHASVEAAAKGYDLPVDAIRDCCERRIKSVGDFIWRYVTDDELFSETNKDVEAPSRKSREAIPVRQYSLDDEFIAEYPSATKASRETGVSGPAILSCCRGVGPNRSSRGFKWRFADNDDINTKE